MGRRFRPLFFAMLLLLLDGEKGLGGGREKGLVTAKIFNFLLNYLTKIFSTVSQRFCPNSSETVGIFLCGHTHSLTYLSYYT